MSAGLDESVRALLEAPNFAHLATVLPDGAPHSVAIWVGVEGDTVAFFTQTTSRKARNLAADGRVAMSILDLDNPYRSGWLRGRVAETLEGDAALAVIDQIAHKYTGKPFPMRSGVAYLVEPERSGYFELPFEHTPAR